MQQLQEETERELDQMRKEAEAEMRKIVEETERELDQVRKQ